MATHAYDTCSEAPCALCAAWEAGIAWADREIEAARDQGIGLAGSWRGTLSDCRAIVEDADDAQQIAACDEAARTTWDAACDADDAKQDAHDRDEDCEGHLDGRGFCTVCGVDHSGGCLVCGGRGYHRDGCEEIG